MRFGYFNPLLAPVEDQHEFYAPLLFGGRWNAALNLPSLLTKKLHLINAIILDPDVM